MQPFEFDSDMKDEKTIFDFSTIIFELQFISHYLTLYKNDNAASCCLDNTN